MNILIMKYVIHQSNLFEKYNISYLGNYFNEDRNGNRPLWTEILSVIKLHSHIVPFTIRHKATEYTKHSF
jgi:hypothetical protein